MRRTHRDAAHAAVLVAVTGFVAWASGRPFVFPSLGPTAYVLATAGDAPATRTRRVLGGHAVGVVAGLLAYHLLAPGLVVTDPSPAFGVEQLRLVGSGVAAVGVTAGGMLATDTAHPPACATTLIVALGLLSSPLDAGIILSAVGLLFVAHRVARRAGVGGGPSTA